MKILERISKLVEANINHLLDQAEDPEVMVKQLIRDMEESIIEMRRETVRAVAREKQLQKQIQASIELARELEEKAKLALQKNDEALARQILARKLHTEKGRDTLEKELQSAAELANQLRADLPRLEDQVQLARRKKEELIRRKRAAEAQLRTQEAARRSAEALNAAVSSISDIATSGRSMQAYEDAIMQIESEAEATREVLNQDIQKELDLQKLAEENAVEEELARLKREQKASASGSTELAEVSVEPKP
jgi:phage shock protein A